MAVTEAQGVAPETRPPSLPGVGREAAIARLIILIGVALRIRTYLSARSLRRDEAHLTLNLVRRSFEGLLRPLDDNQGAPLGFLLLEKSAITALGNNEYALRLVPLLAAIASLPLFALVARRFVGPRPALIGLWLFAVAEPLVYYASEVKQYSVDVAVALAILAAATAPGRDGGPVGRPILLALVGAAGIWFSHPALFVLGGVGLAWLVAEWPPRRLAAPLLVFACWGASFLIDERLFLRDLQASAYMQDFWSGAFMPFPPRSASDVRWYLATASDVFKDPVGLTEPGLAAALFLLGCVSFAGRDRSRLAALTVPIALALIASALRKYPFSTRLILFTAPLFMILIAAGIAYIGRGGDRERKIAAGVLLVILLLKPTLTAARFLARPLQGEELKAVMLAIDGRRRPDDVLYLYFASEPAFEFYSRHADRRILPDVAPIVGANGRADRSAYARDMRRLEGQPRVWVVFSHAIKSDEGYITDLLDGMGRRLDEIQAFGASAYLYDLTKHQGPVSTSSDG